jgi:TRAP-type C4-dicarboxylate transport system permease large subunit
VLPFWFAMMVCIAILIAFPDIALIIPNTMIR